MKTIAIILNSYHNAGPSNVMKALMHYLKLFGYCVMLITLLNKNSREEIKLLKEDGIATFELDYPNKKTALLYAPRSIRRIVNEYKIDVIHSNSLISDSISILSGTTAKHTCTLHNNMFYNYYGHYGKIVSRFMVKLHLFVLQRMDRCICCSKYIYDDIKDHINHVVVIRNGVDKPNATLIKKEEMNIPDNGVVFVYAGVLNSRKNALWLAKSFSTHRLPNEYLLILGDGQDSSTLKELNDDNIIIQGFVDTPTEYFQFSDVYISASLSEGFSLSVLESLSCGNYLLLSDIPSHRELIELCDTTYIGSLFSLTDDDGYVNALNNVRSNLGRKNRKKVMTIANEVFSAKKMTHMYELVFNEIHNNS